MPVEELGVRDPSGVIRVEDIEPQELNSIHPWPVDLTKTGGWRMLTVRRDFFCNPDFRSEDREDRENERGDSLIT